MDFFSQKKNYETRINFYRARLLFFFLKQILLYIKFIFSFMFILIISCLCVYFCDDDDNILKKLLFVIGYLSSGLKK